MCTNYLKLQKKQRKTVEGKQTVLMLILYIFKKHYHINATHVEI